MAKARLGDGAVAHALSAANDALMRSRALKDRALEAGILEVVARIRKAKGQFDEALRTCKECQDELCRKTGKRRTWYLGMHPWLALLVCRCVFASL